MPFKNLAIHRDLEIKASIEDVFTFAREREEIRKRKESNVPQEKWTEDKILQIGRFNNIFREDDKTTKCIFEEANKYNDKNMWRTIFIGRYINRVDKLSILYPLEADLSSQIKRELNPKEAYTNSTAYQLHSGIGKLFGVKGAKDSIHYIDTTIDATYKAMIDSKSIKDATYNVSKAFGGYILFMAYQCAIDWAQLRSDIELLNSNIYEGIGAQATGNAVNMTPNEIAESAKTHWKEAKRKLFPFDAENLMCEFRKYNKRKQYGFQSATSKYRRNFLGKQERLL